MESRLTSGKPRAHSTHPVARARDTLGSEATRPSTSANSTSIINSQLRLDYAPPSTCTHIHTESIIIIIIGTAEPANDYGNTPGVLVHIEMFDEHFMYEHGVIDSVARMPIASAPKAQIKHPGPGKSFVKKA